MADSDNTRTLPERRAKIVERIAALRSEVDDLEREADALASADPLYRFSLPPFRDVTDMEDPISTLRDVLRAIARMSETMDDTDDASAVQRLAWLAGEEVENLDKIHDKLFHALHPDRERLDREGWPADEPAG